ncbi:hypothetical protein DSC45_24440 [Streptomyces sp. YIM 130001]|nr:hypothetical protein DSC45_24440 [Streptomyces sp. YIM 130001]
MPRSVMMATPIVRMTLSTKYAWPVFEPAKRDLRPASPGLDSCRMTISVRMPSAVSVPIHSTKSSYGSQWPRTGRTQSGLNNWPVAFTRVSSSV